MNFKKSIAALVVALMPVAASAQSEALSFIRIHQDASRGALAGAGSLSSDAALSASFDAPTAALLGEENFGASVSFNSWAPSGHTYYSPNFLWRVSDRFALTLGGTYGVGKKYDVYTDTGKADGTYTPSQYVLGLGLAYNVYEGLSLGANVHFAGENLAPEHGYSGISADIAAEYRLSGFAASLGVVSLGTKVKSASGREFNLPTSARAAFAFEGCSLGILAYGLYADADYYLYSSSFGASVGAKVGYGDLACLKGGYHYGSSSCVIPSYGSVGFGGKFSGLSLDFAYLFGGQISGTLMLTAGYRF